jgi:hypothetical protein
MAGGSVIDEVARLLGELEGDAFQQAICGELLRSFEGRFQSVPAKNGDGGVDGLTCSNTHAYFCYGPELQIRTKKNANKELSKGIITKFSSDLCRVFGLKTKGRGSKKSFVEKPNVELAAVLGTNTRLKHLYLVVSYFQDKTIIGALRDHFDGCKTATKAGYIDPSIDFTLFGPREFAHHCGIDELTLSRLKHPVFHASVGPAISSAPPVISTGDFDDKFDWLEGQPTTKRDVLTSLRDQYRDSWAKAIAIEQTLQNTTPNAHLELTSIRADVVTIALEGSLTSSGDLQDSIAQLQTIRKELRSRLDSRLGFIGPHLLDPLSKGETAKLIGECHIEWRPPKEP